MSIKVIKITINIIVYIMYICIQPFKALRILFHLKHWCWISTSKLFLTTFFHFKRLNIVENDHGLYTADKALYIRMYIRLSLNFSIRESRVLSNDWMQQSVSFESYRQFIKKKKPLVFVFCYICPIRHFFNELELKKQKTL